MVVESKYRHRRVHPRTNTPWWIGMVASVLVALAGQSHDLPDTWRHAASVAGIIGTAINGFLIRRP
jgi:hypothetical protein